MDRVASSFSASDRRASDSAIYTGISPSAAIRGDATRRPGADCSDKIAGRDLIQLDR